MSQIKTIDERRAGASQPRIHIYTFGALQVVRDGVAVTEGDWHTRQARQLLKILITERPRAVSTDALIEILWPSSAPHAAATTLRSAINALRNVLEPDRPNRAPSRYIVTQTPGYAFHLTPEIWLDVEEFEHLLNRAHHSADPALRLQLLQRAIDLYQDDYLITDLYADWLQVERDRLRERYFGALLQAAELHAEVGRYPEAISLCRRLLARDEVRENAYQALMRFQAESGDSAGALLTYERCRTILSEELGADPSPLTQHLHQQILKGEIETRHFATPPLVMRPPLEVLLPSPTVGEQSSPELPPRTLLTAFDAGFPSAFVGREREMTILQDRLERALTGRGEWVMLYGEAGAGKTRLAHQLLAEAAARSMTVISAGCQFLERDLPFGPLADAFARYFYALPDANIQALPAGALNALAQIIPSLQDRLSHLPVTVVDPPVAAEENRQRLIDGIVTTVIALATLRPMALFIDDLQWADPDTLTTLNRLVQRISDLPLLLLMAYRSEELTENEALAAFVHAVHRLQRDAQVPVPRFTRRHVQTLVQLHLSMSRTDGQTPGVDAEEMDRLAELLYETTQGNALFVAEALHDLDERLSLGDVNHTLRALLHELSEEPAPTAPPQLRSRRIQELIMERVERLPVEARAVLNLCAVIGRDFSLELLESAATFDPLGGLETLLERKFLIERPDERIDFAHHLVRQTVYDRLSLLQRRRLHLAVAEALVDLGQETTNPGEIAFHYGCAGGSHRLQAAHYSIKAGEKLLQTYGFRQAVEAFDRSLHLLESLPEASPELTRQALQGRGMAFEGLFDPEGVTETYRRLQNWARRHGDRTLMLATYSRLTTMLGLLGQQAESNQVLDEFLDAILSADTDAPIPRVLLDLLKRRSRIYAPVEEQVDGEWTRYQPAPPPIPNPEQDLLLFLEPVHAVVPLFEYGWVLLVQGQVGEATRVLETVVDLATETNQPSIASAAYHQLALTARILGDAEQSQALNEESIAINRAVAGAAGELGSMWPRISSGFLALQAGRLQEAERRFRRIVEMPVDAALFRVYRNSAEIGLGLVALARGQIDAARHLLMAAQADRSNFYPYTFVQALVGLARLEHLHGAIEVRDRWLRKALRFAGERSLLEEYILVLVELAQMHVADAPINDLIDSVYEYVQSIRLESAIAVLEALRAKGVAG
ncbi:MAG: DUF2791 family P-loop domain-containing protein [Caldilinea sp.]|nr:DUF2791 family P-loop domain-containing protein [Caldilinea sp.]MDW8440174.1 DUF2791 family P-loop domain-containing protein [Caldilineaceae bacterium]